MCNVQAGNLVGASQRKTAFKGIGESLPAWVINLDCVELFVVLSARGLRL